MVRIGAILLSLVALTAHAKPLIDHPLHCLVVNIYHEARGEPLKGQIAVANVVMNRVASKHYPDTVCAVVFQRKQFSWTLSPSKVKALVPFDFQIYTVAAQALAGTLVDYSGGSTHFHTTAINPYWASSKTYVTTIGNHRFYRARRS